MDLRKLPDEEIKKLKEKQEVLDALRDYQGKDRIVSIEDALEYIQGLPESLKIACEMPTVNKHLDGFRCGELVVVSGPTGMGKTTLLQSLTYDFNDAGVNSVWFSYEVGVRDLAKRFGGNIPSFVLPLKTIESNFKWLRTRVWESISKFDTKVVFIDHLHYLLDMSYLAKVNTSLAIGMLMRDLKKLAIETDTLIFLVSHLSKTRLEEEPDLDDIRDSSFIGQESDIVLIVYREKNNGKYGNSWIKVAKNRRNGTIGTVPITLQKGRFYEQTPFV